MNNTDEEWMMSSRSLPELREQLWLGKRMETDDFLLHN